MVFKVSARTILELGAELISSDDVALWELIKNAIDAKSRKPIEVAFTIGINKGQLDDIAHLGETISVSEAKRKIANALESSVDVADLEFANSQIDALRSNKDIASLCTLLNEKLNRIEIRDTGCGMSLRDLSTVFLTIGTPARFGAISDAVNKKQVDKAVPFLGEKGVGRLSAMRLGSRLAVRTTTAKDKYFNILRIDWDRFSSDPNDMIDDIDVEPERGAKKKNPNFSGTRLTITGLHHGWSIAKLTRISQNHFSRLTDPFEKDGRTFALKLSYNGTPIDFARSVRKVVTDNAHAIVRGSYQYDDEGSPYLTVKTSVPLYGSPEQTHIEYESDLRSELSAGSGDFSGEGLRTVGPFQFELFWFNRQRLKKPAGFENLKAFRDLIRSWSGIMVYRDGYIVTPYGDEDTDWLELDRAALASQGYKLNKAQFVGRANIRRIANPKLVDQTSREGLRDCPEKHVFVKVIERSIKQILNRHLSEARKSEVMDDEYRPAEVKRMVNSLTARAKKNFTEIIVEDRTSKTLLREVEEAFGKLRQTYVKTSERLKEAELERDQFEHLAGVGLVIEMVAHELTRAVERSREVLDASGGGDVSGFSKTLRATMSDIHNRLKVVDVLSVSSRNVKTKVDIAKAIARIVDSHSVQFARHGISVIYKPKVNQVSKMPVSVVEGKLVQIVENIISNSVYWMRVRESMPGAEDKRITVEFDPSLMTVAFSDTGPGVPVERAESIFKPFVSTKPHSKGRGLGLYIARRCAEYHGGTLRMDLNRLNPSGRLTTFVLQLNPDGGN